MEEIRQIVLRFETSVKSNLRILVSESLEVDEIDSRLVRIPRINEVFLLIEQLKTTTEGFGINIAN